MIKAKVPGKETQDMGRGCNFGHSKGLRYSTRLVGQRNGQVHVQ